MAVRVRPMVPFMPEKMPDLSRKPSLILAATRDSLVPREETETLAGLLERGGADVQLRWVDATHAITSEDVAAGKDWVAEKFAD